MLVAAFQLCSSHALPQDRMPGENESRFVQRLTASMEVMGKGMRTDPVNGDPDCGFAVPMITHHQGAIGMAQAVLLEGNDVIKWMAQEIVVTQQQEIEVTRPQLEVLPSGTAGGSQPRQSDPVCSTPISSRNRVHVAGQTSGTVSVIDPLANKLPGVIHLGDPAPGRPALCIEASCWCRAWGSRRTIELSRSCPSAPIRSRSLTRRATASAEVEKAVLPLWQRIAELERQLKGKS